MTDNRPAPSAPDGPVPSGPVAATRRTTAAERALAEAATRRAAIDARVASLPPEHGARREREPVRYGDWENKGLASDF
jgi:hypothetical protein